MSEDPAKVRERAARWRRENRERKREANRAWAKANPEKQRSYEARIHERNRAVIQAAKDRPCVDCGEQRDPAAMHFDHRPGTTKLFNVGVAWTRSLDALTAEIAKCDVRCASCHQKRHAKERPRDGGRFITA